jgi:hypothetical protein
LGSKNKRKTEEAETNRYNLAENATVKAEVESNNKENNFYSEGDSYQSHYGATRAL